MRSITTAATIAAGFGVLAAGGCARPGGPGGPAAEAPADPRLLAENGLEIRWQTQLLLEPETRVTRAWHRGGYIVCLGSDNRVYVVDAKTGVRLWSADLAPVHETVWPPAVHRDRLWFATTTRLMGFRGADGENIVEEATIRREARTATGEVMETSQEKPAAEEEPWRRTTPAQRRAQAEVARVERRQAELRRVLAAEKDAIELDFCPAGPPATDGTHVFIPDAKGWLQAVGIRPGAVPWGRWTSDAISAAPVVDATRVYFAGHNGVVYASRQNVRHIIWQYQTEDAIKADLRLTDTGTLLAASLDYSLYAFDGASGVPEWEELPNRRYNAGEPLRLPPYTFGEQIFLFSPKAGLTVLDTTSGKPQWQLEAGADLITADADTVYILSRSRQMMGVDRKAGEVRFTIPLRPGTLAAINESGSGLLYLVRPTGHILAAAGAAGPEQEQAPAEAAPAPR